MLVAEHVDDGERVGVVGKETLQRRANALPRCAKLRRRGDGTNRRPHAAERLLVGDVALGALLRAIVLNATRGREPVRCVA